MIDLYNPWSFLANLSSFSKANDQVPGTAKLIFQNDIVLRHPIWRPHVAITWITVVGLCHGRMDVSHYLKVTPRDRKRNHPKWILNGKSMVFDCITHIFTYYHILYIYKLRFHVYYTYIHIFICFTYPNAPCMDYLPTVLPWNMKKNTFKKQKNVGNYSLITWCIWALFVGDPSFPSNQRLLWKFHLRDRGDGIGLLKPRTSWGGWIWWIMLNGDTQEN